MALPQIDIPIYEIQLVSNNQKVQYRPFLVKEKKVLMTASEGKSSDAAYLAIKQIVNNCTFGKIDVENLALFDLQFLFLKIRSKSIGEIADFKLQCSKCTKDVLCSINFDEIKIQKDPEHEKKIMLNDKIGIMMKYPNMTLEKILESSKAEDIDTNIILSCIDYVFDENEIYYAKDTSKEDLENLIDNLTEAQFEKIEKFFTTLPKLEHKISYTCNSCGYPDTYEVEDLYSFFD